MKRVLSQMEPGETGLLLEVGSEDGVKTRLKDYGVVPGIQLQCQFYSPGRHLIAVKCAEKVLALRSKDADRIWVDV